MSNTAFGQIKVRVREADSHPTILSFTNREVYDEVLRRLEADGRIVEDHFWGYHLFQSVDKALECVAVLSGDHSGRGVAA